MLYIIVFKSGVYVITKILYNFSGVLQKFQRKNQRLLTNNDAFIIIVLLTNALHTKSSGVYTYIFISSQQHFHVQHNRYPTTISQLEW